MKRSKKWMILVGILAVAIMSAAWLSPPPVVSYGVENNTEFAGGDGTPENPYRIETAAQLDNVRNYAASSTANFVLSNDIVFSASDFATDGAFYNNGAGWMPIGIATIPFAGTFDGAGHVISGLVINFTAVGTNPAYVGLFGYSEGNIRNVGLTDCNIAISAQQCYAGSILGFQKSGTVSGCCATGTINNDFEYGSSNYVGGIVGYLQSGTISSCYYAGEAAVIEGILGGIAGYAEIGATISDCYNAGNLMSRFIGGGIAGTCPNGAVVTRCYNVGRIAADPQRQGAIIGDKLTNQGITQCYFLKGTGFNYIGTPLNLEQISDPSRYVGFDFVDMWEMLPDSGYTLPVLQKWGVHDRKENTSEFSGGVGDVISPYLIGAKSDLDHVRNHLGSYYRLQNNIDFSTSDFDVSGAYYNAGYGWNPIGGGDSDCFYGSFDGNGKVISGIRIHADLSSRTTYDQHYSTGLFGEVDGSVKNLGLKGTDIWVKSENSIAGGLAASTTPTAAVSNCFNIGNIRAEAGVAMNITTGGIVGNVLETKISNCYSIGTVDSLGNAGGIAGAAKNATIVDCFNGAGVYTASHVNYAGGIIGYSDTCTVKSSLNTGNSCNYTADTFKGKIFGGGLGISTIENCYYLDVAFKSTDGTALNYGQMQQADSFPGLNFNTVWTLDPNGEYTIPYLTNLGIPQYSQNTTDFAGGAGDVTCPYRVATPTQLDNVRKYPGSFFTLENDIAIPTSEFTPGGKFYNNGEGWKPICGELKTSFFGVLNGMGHTISGLKIDVGYQTSDVPGGLIGNFSGELDRLNIDNSSIVDRCSGSNAGSFVAVALSGRITGCKNAGAVQASNYVGGIVGWGKSITITDCMNIGEIGAPQVYANAGGICGSGLNLVDCANYGTIFGHDAGGITGEGTASVLRCFNAGKIVGYYMTGGIAGFQRSPVLENCYNIGEVVGDTYTGGLVGSIWDSGSLKNCYTNGPVTAPYRPVDGLVGQFPSTLTVTDTYYLSDAPSAVAAAIPKTSDEFKFVDTYDGFDFDSVWTWEPKVDRALLQNNPQPVYSITYSSPDATMPGEYKNYYTSGCGNILPVPTDGPSMNLFRGWCETAQLSDQPISVLPFDASGDKTLYGKWTPQQYMVSFDANGGTGIMADEAMIIGSAKVLSANRYSRTGYTFAGWSSTSDGALVYTNSTSVIDLSTTDGAKVVLYAKWIPYTYTVKFYPNGGTGTMASATFTYDVAKPLPANLFKRTGYAFLGWAKTSTGSVVHTNAASVKNLTATNKGTVGLYAKWGASIKSAVVASYSSIKVSWSYVSGATSYTVYRVTSATGTYTKVHTGSSTARSWTNTGLVTGKTYYYKVYPVVGGKTRTFRTYKYATPIPATPALTVTKQPYNVMLISWTPVAGATKYEIYRTSGNGTTNFSLIYTAVPTETSWTNYGVQAQIYYFKIRAYHLEGTKKVYSNYSNVVSADTWPRTDSNGSALNPERALPKCTETFRR